MKGLRGRSILVFSTVLFALYLLVPSYLRFAHNEFVKSKPKASDPWYHSILPSQALKLGLDLQGGVHLVMGIDFLDVYKNAILKLKTNLEQLAEEQNLKNVSVELVGRRGIQVLYPNKETWDKLDDTLTQNFRGVFDFVSQNERQATLIMASTYEEKVHDQAIDQSLETLRNRIDEFGIAEPIIQRHGDDKILVQFPGVKDIGRLKDIIARTAKLSFNIERSGPEMPDGPPAKEMLDKWVVEFVTAKGIKLTEKKPISRYLRPMNEYLAPNTKGDDYHR